MKIYLLTVRSHDVLIINLSTARTPRESFFLLSGPVVVEAPVDDLVKY